ncbi:MAG: Gfo/Idh/MocA family oxidoreductase [Acidobacteria bacterium]|nr:Gfo/Idh/MocA family oxidoreductase [Acidobacteriota bacterium]
MLTRRALSMAVVAAAGSAKPKPIRAAVYGVGHAHAMGKVQALRALPEFELVGVCEPDSRVPRTHKALEGVQWLSEREVLDSSIEFIAVESRVQENLLYARRAIDAGKFVHIDKAPGDDLSKFRDLLAEASRKKLVVQMGYQWRYQPAMQAAIEAARKGWLGRVQHFRAVIDKPMPADSRIELAAFRGGMMFELGCHLIDRATALLGKPKSVIGRLWHHGAFNDTLADNTIGILEYEYAIAEIFVGATNPFGGEYRTIEITGTNGLMSVRPFGPYKMVSHLKDAVGPYPAGRKEHTFPPDTHPSFSPDMIEMAKVIREGAKPSYSAEHDLMTQEVLLRVCGYPV